MGSAVGRFSASEAGVAANPVPPVATVVLGAKHLGARIGGPAS